MTRLTQLNAGVMAYGECLALQQRLHRSVVADGAGPWVIVVEHPPVLTFGKNADRKFLLFAAEGLAREGVAVVDTDRGGEITAHEPGQLVVYPILRLADYKLTPRSYVALLENAVIRTLDLFGIKAHTDLEHPGVWVQKQKICALGVRIKDRATMHGLALNITNSLALFQKIVPCGIAGRGVTSMQKLLGGGAARVSVTQVAPVLIEELARGLGVEPELNTAKFAPLLPQQPEGPILS